MGGVGGSGWRMGVAVGGGEMGELGRRVVGGVSSVIFKDFAF